MKCDACGAPVENGKCTYCGKSFESQATERVQTEPKVAETKETPKKPTNKKLMVCKTCGAEIAKNVKKCPQCGAKIKKPFYKKWWFWLIVVLIIGMGASGGNSEDGKGSASSNDTTAVTEGKDTNSSSESSNDSSSSVANGNQETTENVAPAEDNVPTEYKSALRKAETYSKTMNMSKAGIYDQLTSEYGEQFPEEAAQYAIDNMEADFKENALKKANT